MYDLGTSYLIAKNRETLDKIKRERDDMFKDSLYSLYGKHFTINEARILIHEIMRRIKDSDKDER